MKNSKLVLPLAVVCLMFSSVVRAEDVPTVSESTKQGYDPTIPGLTWGTCAANDSGSASSLTGLCKIITYKNVRYVPYGFSDSRTAVALIGVDLSSPKHPVVSKVYRDGTRMINAITVDAATKTVKLSGPRGTSITIPWADLIGGKGGPTVLKVSTNDKNAAIPKETGADCTCDYGAFTCPVLSLNDVNYWGCKMAGGKYAIIGADAAGKTVKKLDVPALNAYSKLTIDYATKQANFEFGPGKVQVLGYTDDGGVMPGYLGVGNQTGCSSKNCWLEAVKVATTACASACPTHKCSTPSAAWDHCALAPNKPYACYSFCSF